MRRLSGWTYLLISLVCLFTGFTVVARGPRLAAGDHAVHIVMADK